MLAEGWGPHLEPQLLRREVQGEREERAAPQLGQHSREILAELGTSEDEIEDLLRRAIVTEPGPDSPWPV